MNFTSSALIFVLFNTFVVIIVTCAEDRNRTDKTIDTVKSVHESQIGAVRVRTAKLLHSKNQVAGSARQEGAHEEAAPEHKIREPSSEHQHHSEHLEGNHDHEDDESEKAILIIIKSLLLGLLLVPFTVLMISYPIGYFTIAEYYRPIVQAFLAANGPNGR